MTKLIVAFITVTSCMSHADNTRKPSQKLVNPIEVFSDCVRFDLSNQAMVKSRSPKTHWSRLTLIPSKATLSPTSSVYALRAVDSRGQRIDAYFVCSLYNLSKLECRPDGALGAFTILRDEKDQDNILQFVFIDVDLDDDYNPVRIERADKKMVNIKGTIVTCPTKVFE